MGLSPTPGSYSEGHTAGLCTHCLLCLRWSLCLFLFTFMHIKYTGVCVPGLVLTHLCFFYFGAPFLEVAGGQALYTLASCCPEPRRLLGGDTLWGGQVVLLPVFFTVSALALSGNLSSPPNPPTPTSSIICSRPYFGPRLQGRWGVLGNIQDNSKAFSHFLPSEIGTFPIL